MRGNLQLHVCVTTALFERRTRKLRTFVRLETIEANTGRNHKTLGEQVERIDGLRFLLDEKDLLPLCVLVNNLCDEAVTTRRLRGYGAHGVNGD